jgi:very-short-patch-repair endonuclease
MPDKKSSDLSAEYLSNLHQNATHYIHQNAKELRRKTTVPEQKLWALLRNRQLNGKKFRRQHAIGKYIADFYCHECKLVIELDGYFHNTTAAKQYDQARTIVLNELGITVLRFWNKEIMEDIEKVLKTISDYTQ